MAKPTGPSNPEAEAILEQVKVAAARGLVVPSKHARDRMRERGAQAEDVRLAIEGATKATQKDNGTWRLSGGNDAEGDELDVVIDVRCDPIRVVTIM